MLIFGKRKKSVELLPSAWLEYRPLSDREETRPTKGVQQAPLISGYFLSFSTG